MTDGSKRVPPESPFWKLHRLRVIDSACNALYERVRIEPSPSWKIDESKLTLVARIVATSIVRKSPQLRIPAYGALGRLDPDGYDRLSALHGRFDALATDERERVRSLADFVVLAALMDLDHGPTWRTRTRTGALLGAEPGSLVVTYGMFVNGLLSNAREADPMRVDADALAQLDLAPLEVAFAAVEGARSTALEEARRRARAIAVDLPADASGARRPGASLVDQTLAKSVFNAEGCLAPEALFTQCVRVLMPAFEDRTKVTSDRLLADADAAYLSLVYSLHGLIAKLVQSQPARASTPSVLPLDDLLCPPDRWSARLLLDAGVIAPSRDRSIESLLGDRAAREELHALVSIALNAAYRQTLSLMKLDANKLSKSAFLWGAIAGGRALSARARPSV